MSDTSGTTQATTATNIPNGTGPQPVVNPTTATTSTSTRTDSGMANNTVSSSHAHEMQPTWQNTHSSASQVESEDEFFSLKNPDIDSTDFRDPNVRFCENLIQYKRKNPCPKKEFIHTCSMRFENAIFPTVFRKLLVMYSECTAINTTDNNNARVINATTKPLAAITKQPSDDTSNSDVNSTNVVSKTLTNGAVQNRSVDSSQASTAKINQVFPVLLPLNKNSVSINPEALDMLHEKCYCKVYRRYQINTTGDANIECICFLNEENKTFAQLKVEALLTESAQKDSNTTTESNILTAGSAPITNNQQTGNPTQTPANAADASALSPEPCEHENIVRKTCQCVLVLNHKSTYMCSCKTLQSQFPLSECISDILDSRNSGSEIYYSETNKAIHKLLKPADVEVNYQSLISVLFIIFAVTAASIFFFSRHTSKKVPQERNSNDKSTSITSSNRNVDQEKNED